VLVQGRTQSRAGAWPRVWLFLGLLLVVALGLGARAAVHWQQVSAVRTLLTLRKVDEYPLYVMYYQGDYGFREFLDRGSRTVTGRRLDLAGNAWTCTCFAGLSRDGDRVFGRNFDWTTQAALLLFTAPPDGYASVSMVDITYLGFGNQAISWAERRRLLQAPYMPFDGMNERGLAVGMMAVEGEAGHDPTKVTISSLEAIRLLLDYAQDVDEAVALLTEYNIDFGGGPPLHYLLADRSGSSAVVEFVRGEMRVVPSRLPWQVATNFCLDEVQPAGDGSPCWRYNAAWRWLEDASGRISVEQAMDLLQAVSQPGGSSSTRWSIAYNLNSGAIDVAMGRQFETVHAFQLVAP